MKALGTTFRGLGNLLEEIAVDPVILPTFNEVVAAANRLEGFAHKTPVLTSRTIDEEIGAQIFFKCENLQRTGSFKFRGAFNSLAKFDEQQRKAGVVAFSSGNHAQGIALAAALLKMPATIVMPNDAPAAKVAATKGYGATIIFYDRYTEDREAIGRALAAEHGMTLIPSYDHPDVLSGQGTAAKELLESTGPLDVLFVGLGGGGMLSGTTLSTRALAPECLIYGVEPEAGNDGQESFRKGEIVHIDTPDTIADGAQTQHLGHYTFPIILNGVNDIVTVSDQELIAAMKFFAERMKIMVEPTGCLGLAAVRKMKDQLQGKKVGIIITGGNVDIERYARFLTTE
ncbi:threo-3-hydroxy-L-aspartate ammonia-lyase [Pseudomonas sp. B21-048]|uniref:threo-3-hydroxy-L-aspartate ammonia-lyase n=1 Tax=Pseudomonas sp. B21-048 TaxID=2895490 RepID=UPI00215E40D2|nr:threo-3-hydroxy-L-aspartate ammonia-lyase [Pseudomonas sp. B21-048]UVK97649.1 threo-3-hydroxy-L-aspartate ammonia-lyase [Pseudomonas sp. B21-048]